ncbi:Detected protein of unknown function [Hibiscus syriacus]|uniref:Uncharacterized protein n=1 Tax=Hibiscus syriacus TaxID=106335 RepID=A0A6A2YM08_HIBSY|nr:uncharacterized protein LOC120160314 [Hibiscus syriacus]KAE8680359.1 Detected protein of unknown function [Hibiscus syriacus]
MMEKKSAPEEGKGKQPTAATKQSHHQPPNISPMYPVTHDAYGGGMYGTEQGQAKKPEKPPASETQGADGPDEGRKEPKHKAPPSSGDRDIDITGQSYIQ